MDQSYEDAAHLFRRAGFGAVHEEIEAYKNWGWTDLVNLVLDTSRAPAPPPLPDLSKDRGWYAKYKAMSYYWLDQARRPVDQAPIVEKVVLFLSGLLTSSLEKTNDFPGLMAQNQAFRTMGMGSYRDLLHLISTNTAMIRYLDNADNVVGDPNENFSRELMELFTLGVGNYTETDVTEAARAWTGHGFVRWDDRRYQFKAEKHDFGTKTFLGATGPWDGPDIINLILDRRRDAHARFLCHKLWSFFAYPVDPNDQVVTDIMPAYAADLQIGDAIRAIFFHTKFRSTQARRALVRSPIEYMVALMRHTGTTCEDLHPEWWASGLGQVPFNPPNVSGWRQNGYWVTSTAAWSKMQLASHLRWLTRKRGDVEHIDQVTGWKPRRFAHSPEACVDAVLWNYKIGPINPNSRQQLIEYARTTQANDDVYWSNRAGLLRLALLLPELQVA
jgi:uncharacterized protein (DUF1800 family)